MSDFIAIDVEKWKAEVQEYLQKIYGLDFRFSGFNISGAHSYVNVVSNVLNINFTTLMFADPKQFVNNMLDQFLKQAYHNREILQKQVDLITKEIHNVESKKEK